MNSKYQGKGFDIGKHVSCRGRSTTGLKCTHWGDK